MDIFDENNNSITKIIGCEGSGKRDSTCTLEEESTGAVVLRGSCFSGSWLSFSC